ncbi:hypothetical protein [Lactovum odontotermitis]
MKKRTIIITSILIPILIIGGVFGSMEYFNNNMTEVQMEQESKKVEFAKAYQEKMETYVETFYPKVILDINWEWDKTETIIGSGPIGNSFDGILLHFYVNNDSKLKGSIQILPKDTEDFAISKGGTISGVEVTGVGRGSSYDELSKTINMNSLSKLGGD